MAGLGWIGCFPDSGPSAVQARPPASPRGFLPLLFLLACATQLVTGCKLVELKMPGDPMPKEDYAMRGQTREFANLLAGTIQHVSDSIARQTDDQKIRSHCVQWKIGAISAVRGAVLRSAPKMALLDAWAFCRQMTQYVEGGVGANLFGPWQPVVITNSQALERRLAETARTLLSNSEFKKMDEFLAEHVRLFPVQTLAFDRESVVARWEDLDGKLPPIPPAGTTSEALSDVADRLQMLGQQVPEEVRWRLTLEADELEAALARTGPLFDRLDLALKTVAEAAVSSPGTVSNAVSDLRLAFLPAMERFEHQWEATTRTLQTERQALTATLAVERAAVLKAVDEQRAAFMKEAQTTTHDVIDQSMTHARAAVREILFYVVLLSAIVLGLPFLIGLFLGRVWGRTTAKKPPGEVESTQ